MNLSEGQKEVMEAEGHLLVTGGPGSGKTTISILKAARIAEQDLRRGQKILFLSFARATVSRVEEAIEQEQKIPLTQKRVIDVETYHSFFWRVLKAHGYLVGLPRRLSILTPPSEAVALSFIRSDFPARGRLTDAQKASKKNLEDTERRRLAIEEGRVCFDLCAPYAGDLLCGSSRIRRLVANRYPVVILDEFQDTNEEQWRVVKALECRLVALADPEQRIHEWIGADPARLNHFCDSYRPTIVDLGMDNHRSAGTDIALFGDDVLTGNFRQNSYRGIEVDFFESISNLAMTKLVMTVYSARERLKNAGVANWTLAILVPTKKMTRLVSDALQHPPAKMPQVRHFAVIELEGVILGAEVIAFLLQPTDDHHFNHFIDLICSYYQGKGGGKPTKTALKEAESIDKARDKWFACKVEGREPSKSSIILSIRYVYKQACAVRRTGVPDDDWRAVRQILEDGCCKRLEKIAQDARNLRILGRGTQLRQELSRDWRENGSYRNALTVTRRAFAKEHFSRSKKVEDGVIVMNMHKAKGKQFDEVIIFEHWPVINRRGPPYNGDRIVLFNSRDKIDNQARQNFRVSVTRSRQWTTILTPKDDPCVLLDGYI